MKPECSKCEFYLRCKFKKPTVKEIQDYAAEIGWPEFDADYFFDKQETTGWMVKIGNTYKPMASWKGVVRTWHKAAIRRGDIKPAQKTFVERMRENEGQS